MTVRWFVAAEDDLASMGMSSATSDDVRRAAYEVDELLRFDPSRKGRSYALSVLDEAEVELLEDRTGELPEDLRMIRCGPLEVFFVAREADGMAIVYLVTPRTDR